MALNIFEPRYRLMVRRCMEGNRRFAMGTVDRQHQICPVSIGPPGLAGGNVIPSDDLLRLAVFVTF